MTQQLSHSTDNIITSMHSFTHHYTSYLILAAATYYKLRESIAHANVTVLSGTGSFACPVQVSKTYTAQILLLRYTGYKLLILKATTQDRPRLPSSIYIHPLMWHIQNTIHC